MQKTMNIDGQKVVVRVRRRHSRGNSVGWSAKIGKATYFFAVLDPQEAIDKAVAKYRAAAGNQSILTIDEANAIAAGRATVLVDPVDASLWLVEGDGWTESHEPMNRSAWERFLADQTGDGGGTESDAALAQRIATHPMNTPSDLAYFRRKGYSDAEILAFWDRDHAMGCKPCHHDPAPDVLGSLRPRRGRREINHEFMRIAQRVLGIETLAERGRDALDFHNVSVRQIRDLLEAAYELGRKSL